MKNALILGSDSAVGRAAVLSAAKHGYNTVLLPFDPSDPSDRLASQVTATGQKAHVLRSACHDDVDARACMDEATRALGEAMTLLVLPCRDALGDTLENVSPHSWETNLNSVLGTPLWLIQAFAAQLPPPTPDERGELAASGLVISVVDRRLRGGEAENLTFSLAQEGLKSLTRTAALSLAPKCRVNEIGLGPEPQGTYQKHPPYAKRQSEGRSGVSDFEAAFGYFLDMPSLTGQHILVDADPVYNGTTQA